MRTGGIEVAIVTGLSGAGRSTAAKVLEDLGWFVVDNLPPELIETMVDLGTRSPGQVTRIAVVMDVRSRAFTADLGAVIKELDARGVPAARAVPRRLRRRADPPVRGQSAASHPLQGDGRLVRRHRRGARAARAAARRWPTSCVDTSHRSVHQLRGGDRERVRRPTPRTSRAASPSCRSATSTGCRRTPTSSSTCASCPTRTGSPSCASTTGREAEVRDYVLSPGGRRGVPRPLPRAAAPRRRRLPARGQALPDARGRLHRRQAPQRRDRRGARAAPGRAEDGVRGHGVAPRPGARVRATRPLAPSPSEAATGCTRRSRRCAGVDRRHHGRRDGRRRRRLVRAAAARAGHAAAGRPADGARRAGRPGEPRPREHAVAAGLRAPLRRARARSPATPSATCCWPACWRSSTTRWPPSTRRAACSGCAAGCCR